MRWADVRREECESSSAECRTPSVPRDRRGNFTTHKFASGPFDLPAEKRVNEKCETRSRNPRRGRSPARSIMLRETLPKLTPGQDLLRFDLRVRSRDASRSGALALLEEGEGGVHAGLRPMVNPDGKTRRWKVRASTRRTPRERDRILRAIAIASRLVACRPPLTPPPPPGPPRAQISRRLIEKLDGDEAAAADARAAPTPAPSTSAPAEEAPAPSTPRASSPSPPAPQRAAPPLLPRSRWAARTSATPPRSRSTAPCSRLGRRARAESARRRAPAEERGGGAGSSARVRQRGAGGGVPGTRESRTLRRRTRGVPRVLRDERGGHAAMRGGGGGVRRVRQGGEGRDRAVAREGRFRASGEGVIQDGPESEERANLPFVHRSSQRVRRSNRRLTISTNAAAARPRSRVDTALRGGAFAQTTHGRRARVGEESRHGRPNGGR